VQPVADVEEDEHGGVDDEGILVKFLLVLVHLAVEQLVFVAHGLSVAAGNGDDLK
jgi:hypothetical protein